MWNNFWTALIAYHRCHMLPFSNYLQYNRVRPNNQRGGGVSFLVHTSIASSNIVINSTTKTFEYLCRQLVKGKENIICAGVYKPPRSDCSIFLEEIDALLSCISNNKASCVMLVGDFNVKLLDDCKNSIKFLNVMLSHSLYPTVFLPTRPASRSLIDNIFISWPSFFEKFCYT